MRNILTQVSQHKFMSNFLNISFKIASTPTSRKIGQPSRPNLRKVQEEKIFHKFSLNICKSLEQNFINLWIVCHFVMQRFKIT